MSVKMRQLVEREIIGRFVDDAIAAGYRLAVSLERGYDHDEMLFGSTDKEKIMEAAFAGDECHIFIQPKDGPMLEKRPKTPRERLFDSMVNEDHSDERDSVVSVGWVYAVFGNDGWDVISDYSSNDITEELMKGASEVSEKYQ